MLDMNISSDPQVLKKRIRTRMSAIREMIGAEGREKADKSIAEQAIAHPAYEAADMVFTYLSFGSEVDTRAIIRDAWSKGKTVCVPRCIPGTNRMEWIRIDDFDNMESGAFGLEEPVRDEERIVEVPGPEDGVAAVAFVPGYSFDMQGYRVGYGGGYYDVFLPTFGGTSIGLCRAAQRSTDPIPSAEHDIAVDAVIFG